MPVLGDESSSTQKRKAAWKVTRLDAIENHRGAHG